jgi:hypothetical protein
MTSHLFPLDKSSSPQRDLASAPNPKPSSRDKSGFGRLASLYTAFSTDFAAFALELCQKDGHVEIADPFAGMGTIAEAGRGLPVHLYLNDLNPFAALTSVFRSSRKDLIHEAIESVKGDQIAGVATCERTSFDALMGETAKEATVDALVRNASGDAARFAALRIYLLSLVRLASFRRLGGSNPTWTKRAGDYVPSPDVLRLAHETVTRAATAYADSLVDLHSEFTAAFTSADVADLQRRSGSLDAIITSPPYPNRTDYIRHYLPAVEVLIAEDGDAERRLRETQIGTPLIRQGSISDTLPKLVQDTIESVRNHPSYASERYYAKGFAYYFTDLQNALRQFREWLKVGGSLILVVQDSHYKEMRIPVADLITDLALSVGGFELRSRKDFLVPQTLARLSPHSRASSSARKSFESALQFRRINK